MEVNVNEEIPENPPKSEEEYRRLSWKMQRENYRIAKNYDRLSRGAKIVLAIMIWLAGSIATVATLVEMFKNRSH